MGMFRRLKGLWGNRAGGCKGRSRKRAQGRLFLRRHAVLEPLESRCLLSVDPLGSVPIPGLDGLRHQASKYNEAFFVYENRDAGGNHFIPSWYTNGGTGFQVDTAYLRGPGDTCIRVDWSGQPGNDGWRWNGIGFEEPEGHFGFGVDGNAYRLFDGGTAPLGARLVFDAKIDPKDLGDQVECGFAAAGDTPGQRRQWFSFTTQWSTYSIAVGGLGFSTIHLGFIASANDQRASAGNGVRFYLDNVRYEWSRPDGPRLVQSYNVRPDLGTPFDGSHKNTAYTYDQVVALMVLGRDGDPQGPRLSSAIGGGLLDVLGGDWTQNPGAPAPPDGAPDQRFYDAYMSGDPLDNQHGSSRPTGWWDDQKGWLMSNYGLDAGVNAWAILGFLDLYGRTSDPKYFSAGEKVGAWIASKLRDPLGGFRIGWKPDGNGGWRQENGKSVEHNLDLYAAFTRLAGLEKDPVKAAFWQDQARYAGDFVMSMYDPLEGRFYIGTDPSGKPDKDHLVLDAQTWTYLSLGTTPRYAAAIDWTRQIRWAEQNLRYVDVPRGLVGFDFGYNRTDPNDHAPDGIWWEGTAQMAVVYDAMGDFDRYRELIGSIRKFSAMQGTPLIDATDRPESLSTGIFFADGSPWRIYPRESVAASAWAAMAENGFNPFWSQTVAAPLGQIDFLRVDHQDASRADRLYALETTQSGYLTIEAIVAALPEQVGLTLYDANLHPVAQSSLIFGNPRIDYPVAGADLTYYLRFAGPQEDATLRLANLVEHRGSVVLVSGTSGPDSFEFHAAVPRTLRIDGVRYDFQPATAATFSFSGGNGSDLGTLYGTSGDDAASLSPGSAELTGPGLQVTLDNAEEITVWGEGGQDVARLYDSAGDDAFVASPASARLSGIGFTNRANNFRYAYAYASNGNDTATLLDSLGNDVFVGDPLGQYAALYGSAFYLRANAFDSVQADSTAGVDLAKLYDSSGIDTFAAGAVSARLDGTGFSNRVNRFRYVIGYASGGHDTATLSGSDQTDTFVGTPAFSTFSGSSFYNRVSSFETVIAGGTPAADDVAKLYDSSGNDALSARPKNVTLSGTGFSIQAKDFRFVHAYSTTGGTDTADLYDSTGNDTFTASPSYAVMYGTAYYNRANYFESATGHRSEGTDLAKLYDSPGDDLLEAYADYVRFHGAGFSNRAEGFRSVQAFSTAGGLDTANLHGTSGDDTVTGTPDYVRLQNASVDATARGFKKNYVLSGNGGNDKATLYDSSANDRLDAAGKWARLSYSDRFLDVSELTSLAKVTAISSKGDHDTKKVGPTDYLLETIGPWEDVSE